MTGKEKIIDASIKLFAEEGFENTSIQRLAEVSGVAQGLLYRHFKSKNHLLLYLLQMGFGQISETLQPYRDSALNFEQAFHQHIVLCVKLLGSNYNLWKTLHSVRQNNNLMHELGISIDMEKEVIEPISYKIRRSGYENPNALAWLLVGVVDGITAMHLLHPDKFPLKKIEKLLTEVKL
jgi:AcrR family transcriptional regulator